MTQLSKATRVQVYAEAQAELEADSYIPEGKNQITAVSPPIKDEHMHESASGEIPSDFSQESLEKWVKWPADGEEEAWERATNTFPRQGVVPYFSMVSCGTLSNIQKQHTFHQGKRAHLLRIS